MNAVTRLFTDKPHQPTHSPAEAAAEFRRLLEASLPKALRDAENAVSAVRDRREELVNRLQALTRDLNTRMPSRSTTSAEEKNLTEQVAAFDRDELRNARSHLRDVRESVGRYHHVVVGDHLRTAAPNLLAATQEIERVFCLLHAADSFAMAHAIQPLNYSSHMIAALPVIRAIAELIAPGSTKQSDGRGG